MVHMRSAVVGSSATVAVAVGVFFAVSAGNAAEPVPVVVEEPALVGHYSTVESVDPIVYVPEPVVVAEPVVEPAPEPVPVEEPVSEPAPAPVVEPAPERDLTDPPLPVGVDPGDPPGAMPPPPPPTGF